MKTLKLPYQDALGTFSNAIVKLSNDASQIYNLDELPIDLQHQLINGDFDNILQNDNGALSV
jgi:hypothetical protein